MHDLEGLLRLTACEVGDVQLDQPTEMIRTAPIGPALDEQIVSRDELQHRVLEENVPHALQYASAPDRERRGTSIAGDDERAAWSARLNGV